MVVMMMMMIARSKRENARVDGADVGGGEVHVGRRRHRQGLGYVCSRAPRRAQLHIGTIHRRRLDIGRAHQHRRLDLAYDDDDDDGRAVVIRPPGRRPGLADSPPAADPRFRRRRRWIRSPLSLKTTPTPTTSSVYSVGEMLDMFRREVTELNDRNTVPIGPYIGYGR